jgi:hypothetical protein
MGKNEGLTVDEDGTDFGMSHGGTSRRKDSSDGSELHSDI